jgi:hypothetical protein
MAIFFIDGVPAFFHEKSVAGEELKNQKFGIIQNTKRGFAPFQD